MILPGVKRSVDNFYRFESLVDGHLEIKFFIVADGECVGDVALHVTRPPTPYIRQLFVKEKYRRMGVGRYLVYQCLVAAQSHGGLVSLWVAPENLDVVPFWNGRGFAKSYEYESGTLLMTRDVTGVLLSPEE